MEAERPPPTQPFYSYCPDIFEPAIGPDQQVDTLPGESGHGTNRNGCRWNGIRDGTSDIMPMLRADSLSSPYTEAGTPTRGIGVPSATHIPRSQSPVPLQTATNETSSLSKPLPRLAPRPLYHFQATTTSTESHVPQRARRVRYKCNDASKPEQPRGRKLRDIDRADMLLLKLKDQENLPWREIWKRYIASSGRTCTIPALQMRLQRLRGRLMVC